MPASRNVYLIGFDETVDAMRTYKVERIRTSTAHRRPLRDPRGLRPGSLARPLVGDLVRPRAASTEVGCASTASVAHRVRESVWHRSQELAELAEAGSSWPCTVAGIVEIRPWILSWGDAVEVVAPPALREAVARMVQRAADRYAG